MQDRDRHLTQATSALARGQVFTAFAECRSPTDIAADLTRSAGTPLEGQLLSVKDTFDVAGLTTTAGSRRLADNRAATSAPAVERLTRAGATVVAKSNVPPMAGDLITENSLFGLTTNPIDVARTPGGSSGGGAAAVASGAVDFDLSSDHGGSVRLAAHYTGVVGHKFSYGLVPLLQHVPPMPGEVGPVDLRSAGVLASPARGVVDLVRHLTKPSPGESALATPLLGELPDSPRVAAWLVDERCPIASDHRDVLRRGLATLKERGCHVIELQAPPIDLGEIAVLARILMAATTSTQLSDDRFEFISSRVEASAPAGDDYGSMDMFGVAASHREWLRLDARRWALLNTLELFFEDYDAIAMPVSAVLAPFHPVTADRYSRTVTDGRTTVANFDQMWWSSLATAALLPATVVPVGLVDGLPVGLQLVGGRHQDLVTSGLADIVSRRP